jgi:hypothetical protein
VGGMAILHKRTLPDLATAQREKYICFEVASQKKTLAIAIGNKVLFGNIIKEINFPIN